MKDGRAVTGGATASGFVQVLGVNLTDHSRAFQLFFCCSGIFFGFMINGVCEEYVFRKLNFSYAWYFTLIQSLIYIALVYGQDLSIPQRSHTWRSYLTLSFVWVGSVGLTKASLKYINYPAQIMFKSSKVIPVMLMGRFIPGLGRTYSAYEYTGAFALVVGLVIFTLADVSVTPTFEVAGLLMLTGALVFDAFLGNVQEALFKAGPSTTQKEVLFYTNVLAIPFLVVPTLATGELWMAWQSGLEFPTVYLIICVAALATYVGQLNVLALIALFGAAAAYMVTSVRKAFTLCVSYLIFTKPFNFDHLLGMSLIFLSLSMKMLPKNFPAALFSSFRPLDGLVNSKVRGFVLASNSQPSSTSGQDWQPIKSDDYDDELIGRQKEVAGGSVIV